MKKLFHALFSLIFPPSKEERFVELLREKGVEMLERADESPSSWIHPIWNYKDKKVRVLLHLLKYHNNPTALEVATETLYDELISWIGEETLGIDYEKWILVPVPLHKKKKAKRGWNQCELLAHAIGKLDEGRFFEVRTDLIKKHTETKSQTETKNKQERLINIRNSFRIPDKKREVFLGRKIIIIDDVTTTGATLKEIRKLISENTNARKITAFTLAH